MQLQAPTRPQMFATLGAPQVQPPAVSAPLTPYISGRTVASSPKPGQFSVRTLSPTPPAALATVRKAPTPGAVQMKSPSNLANKTPAMNVLAPTKGAAPPPRVMPSTAQPAYAPRVQLSPPLHSKGSPSSSPPSKPNTPSATRLSTPRLARPKAKAAEIPQRSLSTGACAGSAPVLERIVAHLRDRDELKEHVVRCFSSVASKRKHLDLTGLRHFRALLTQALRVPDQTFGDLMTDYVRFDFDGNGTLELNEVYKLVKFHLWEYSKKFGGCDAKVSIPFKSMAEAGYATSKQLGKGNQGVITLATDRDGTARCIKSYKKGSMTQHGLDMLKEEFEAMKLVGCERLAETFEIFQDSQCYYMVNEVYYGGDFQTLRSRSIAQGVDMDEEWWRTLIRQCLRALEFMHQQAMIHCDIKEPNMMLKTEDFHNPEVVLIDFGLSKAMGAGETGIWGGTFGYIPPETHEHKKWFPRGDMFSLGVVVFQLLTDSIPDPEICLPVEKGLFLHGCKTLNEVRQATFTRKPPLHLMSQYPGLMDLTGLLLEKQLSRRVRAPVALAHKWIVSKPGARLRRAHSKPLRSKHRMATPGIVDLSVVEANDPVEDEVDALSNHDEVVETSTKACPSTVVEMAAATQIMDTLVEGSEEDSTSARLWDSVLHSGSSKSSGHLSERNRCQSQETTAIESFVQPVETTAIESFVQPVETTAIQSFVQPVETGVVESFARPVKHANSESVDGVALTTIEDTSKENLVNVDIDSRAPAEVAPQNQASVPTRAPLVLSRGKPPADVAVIHAMPKLSPPLVTKATSSRGVTIARGQSPSTSKTPARTVVAQPANYKPIAKTGVARTTFAPKSRSVLTSHPQSPQAMPTRSVQRYTAFAQR